METNIIISIGIYKTLSLIGGLIVATWYASHRLTKVETKVDGFDTRLTNLEGRLDKAFVSQSPISLLPKGQKILEESGFKNWIDENKETLLSQCKSKNLMNNQYNIQESAFKFFDKLDFGDFENKLKETAFNYGMALETVRRIGGIYFRDLCLLAHGYKPEDLDHPDSI